MSRYVTTQKAFIFTRYIIEYLLPDQCVQYPEKAELYGAWCIPHPALAWMSVKTPDRVKVSLIVFDVPVYKSIKIHVY